MARDIPFSVLDLSQVGEGGSVSEALNNSAKMAQTAEALGYQRYWLAEHHGMPGIASAATAVVIAHVGHATKTIRVGSGGIMLPNHSPMVIAEQFGTLEALFPGRVDLGLGRAPGSDMATNRALRRNLEGSSDQFPNDIMELQGLLGPIQPGQRLIATPGAGSNVPLWLLGSSLYSAQLAAALGLPYAFASHFAPDYLYQALQIYRSQFRPSAVLDEPYAMVGVMGVAADTDDEARHHFTSMQQGFVNLRRGEFKAFPKPISDIESFWTPQEKAMVEHTLRFAAVGAAETVRAKLDGFLAETQADELIISMPIHNFAARLRSVEIFAGVRQARAPEKRVAQADF
jgi:luciferase family oxidoreductase group 1